MENKVLMNNFINDPNYSSKSSRVKSIKNIDDMRTNIPKELGDFTKITGYTNLNTFGSQPIIIFKKDTKTCRSNEPRNMDLHKPNNFMTDGGLRRKVEKFNYGPPSLSQNGSSKTISRKEELEIKFKEAKEKRLPLKNNYVKNQKRIKPTYYDEIKKEQEHLKRIKKSHENQVKFSQTVRESNSKNLFKMRSQDKTKKNSSQRQKQYDYERNVKGSRDFQKKKSTAHSHSKNDEEQNIEISEEKVNYMNKLIENSIACEIKGFQYMEKKLTPKEILINKKRQVLENNGFKIPTEEDLEDILLEDESVKEDKSVQNKPLKNEKNSLNTTNSNKIRNVNNNSPKNFLTCADEASPKKQQLKPRVDPFEYIHKINEERKISNKDDNKRSRTHSTKFYYPSNKHEETNKIISNLNDSFRKKTSDLVNKKSNDRSFSNKEKPCVVKGDEHQEQLDTDEVPYVHKTNRRTKQEIKDFISRKNKEQKEKQSNEEMEKHKKNFEIYKNLYNLNNKNYEEVTPNYIKSKVTNRPIDDFSSPASVNSPSNNNIKNPRKKIIVNEYYIGTDSSVKNNSTIIDNNEYYMNIIESQQIYINSDLEKINYNNNINQESTNTNRFEQYEEVTENPETKTTQEKKPELSNPEPQKTGKKIDDLQEFKKQVKISIEQANKNFSPENISEAGNLASDGKTLTEDKSKEVTTSKNKTIQKEEQPKKESPKKNPEKSSDKSKTNKTNNSESKKKQSNASSNNKPKQKEDKKISINNKNPKLKIESNNTGSSAQNTKEKNLPSLSHTYNTTSNPNRQIDIEIEPRAVLNLVEIIKLLMQRKVFLKLYENYITQAIIQRYSIAFAFFVAICKQYPFRKIEEFCNYKSYYYAFLQLFKPFLKKNFRFFVECCYTKKKVIFLTELLERMIKFKAMERIYMFSQVNEDYLDKEGYFFKKIMSTIVRGLCKPELKEAFNKIKNKAGSSSDKIKSLESEQSKQKKTIESGDSKPKTNSDNSQKHKEFQKIQQDSEEDLKKEISIEKKITDEDDERLHRMANYSPKMNTFLYESSDSMSKSSYTVEPNSENNDQLHRLKMMMILKRQFKMQGDDYDEDDDDNFDKSRSLNISSGAHGGSSKPQNKKISLEDSEEYNSKKFEDNSSKGASKKNALDSPNQKLENDKIKKQKEKEEKEKAAKLKKEQEEKEKAAKLKKEQEEKEKAAKLKKEQEEKAAKLKKEQEEKAKKEKEEKAAKLKKEKEEKAKKEKEEKIKREQEEKAKLKKEQEEKAKKEQQEVERRLIEKKQKEQESDTIPEQINDGTGKLTQSELDISADKDSGVFDWEYNISSSGNAKQNKAQKPDSKKEKEGSNTSTKQSIPIPPKNSNSDVKIEEELVIEESDADKNKEAIKNKEKKPETKDVRKSSEDDEYANDFEIGIDIEKDDENNNNDNIINIIKNEIKPNDKSRNTTVNKQNEEKDKKEIQNIPLNKPTLNEKGSDSIQSKQPSSLSTLHLSQIKNPDKFADDLADEILANLLKTEIKNKKAKLIPHKTFKYDIFGNLQISNSQSASLTNSVNSAGNPRENALRDFPPNALLQLNLRENSLQSLNDSLMTSYSVYSVFNRTIKDKKKEHSLNLYIKQVAPKLVKLIREEIILKYPRIYNNISTPFINKAEGLMVSLSIQDADMLRENYKKTVAKEEIENIFDKKKILDNFEAANKQIRQKDNLTSDNFYDNMLNECLCDTAIELIKKERIYGENGDPLPWSSRTHEIAFKYDKNDPKKLADYVSKNILKILHNRIGLISDNYDYMNTEQLNQERDKRLLNAIKNDLDETEYQWRNLEMEETQLKVEVTELIMEQLYNEVIEILEHIQYSRAKPELYQNKSIYACEEIPKLSFQQTTTENNVDAEGEDNDLINM